MMETTKGSRREVTLPAATFVELLRGAADDREKLRERGRAAGRILAERLLSPQDRAQSARALPAALFWKRIGELFAGRGWGTLSHASPLAGIGELRSEDWIEADRADGGECAFTAGVIEAVLQHVSGARLEVREVECRAAGAPACRFLFGSAAAIEAAHASTSAAGAA